MSSSLTKYTTQKIDISHIIYNFYFQANKLKRLVETLKKCDFMIYYCDLLIAVGSNAVCFKIKLFYRNHQRRHITKY